MNGASTPSRAQRFAIRTPIRYREVSGETWFEGIIENISDSGILFHASQHLAIETAVEMRFTLLQGTVKGELPAEIVCHGMIVRSHAAEASQVPPALAATIQRYRFVRRRQARSAAV